MKLKGRSREWILIGGLILLILGIWVTAFTLDTRGHLKIYFSIVGSSVKILEASPEFNLPLAGIQPYEQNLTSGTRTLIVGAFEANETFLNQTYFGIGVGFDVFRTRTLNPSPASNANVTVILKLVDGGTLLSQTQTVTSWGSSFLWQTVGVSLIVVGVVLIVSNVRLRAKKRRKKPRNPKNPPA